MSQNNHVITIAFAHGLHQTVGGLSLNRAKNLYKFKGQSLLPGHLPQLNLSQTVGAAHGRIVGSGQLHRRGNTMANTP